MYYIYMYLSSIYIVRNYVDYYMIKKKTGKMIEIGK